MHFGLLSYPTYNLGDFVQSIAARKFLPRVDRYLDREALDEAGPIDGMPVKLIMNAWFCHRPDKWPPSPSIDPLLISVHVTHNPEPGSGFRAREEFARSPQVLRYLQEHGPVGARDHDTLAWLKSLGIESYYSGCLTLTLDRPAVPREPFVVLSDVPEAVAMRVQRATTLRIRYAAHYDDVTVGTEARLERAAALIDLYARASCVVTSRMHGALPCLAMGTPTLLVETAWDPYRFAGLRDLVHHCSVDDFLSGRADYDVGHPPPNPTTYLPLRAELERRATAFTKGQKAQPKPFWRFAGWLPSRRKEARVPY
jgi:polysaccharide pyruvyl transferase